MVHSPVTHAGCKTQFANLTVFALNSFETGIRYVLVSTIDLDAQ